MLSISVLQQPSQPTTQQRSHLHPQNHPCHPPVVFQGRSVILHSNPSRHSYSAPSAFIQQPVQVFTPPPPPATTASRIRPTILSDGSQHPAAHMSGIEVCGAITHDPIPLLDIVARGGISSSCENFFLTNSYHMKKYMKT